MFLDIIIAFIWTIKVLRSIAFSNKNITKEQVKELYSKPFSLNRSPLASNGEQSVSFFILDSISSKYDMK